MWVITTNSSFELKRSVLIHVSSRILWRKTQLYRSIMVQMLAISANKSRANHKECESRSLKHIVYLSLTTETSYFASEKLISIFIPLHNISSSSNNTATPPNDKHGGSCLYYVIFYISINQFPYALAHRENILVSCYTRMCILWVWRTKCEGRATKIEKRCWFFIWF